MRTTIKLDDNLLHDLKVVALESDRSMTDIVEDACREFIYRRREAKTRPRVELTVSYGKGGTFPGIDINSAAALEDYLDSVDAAT